MLNFIRQLILRCKGIKINSSSFVHTLNIGASSRIWAYTNISKDVLIGSNCNICDRCFIEDGVSIGSDVTIKTGVSIWTGITIEDDVFIGPGVQFCNDKYPRSKQYIKPLKLLIKANSSIGAGSVILPGITIGENSIIGAGSVVTKDVPKNVIVAGNPAAIIRHIS